jgi:nucleotide sugar dehydrogenase
MPTIGFIGQGWIGKNYSDDFEKRGFKVVRYANEELYIANKNLIKDCDIVFIAVPTPTTPDGFDDKIVRNVIKLVGKGKSVVIKSTILPGRTKEIQKENPNIFVFHSPEFLTEATAAYDAAFPKRNIIGAPVLNAEYTKRAEEILSILPPAPFTKICDSTEAEIIKYSKNCMGFARVILTNIFYDYAQAHGADWATIQEAISADPQFGPTYMNPIHKSGRGAGGHCFIKDFAAFTQSYKELVNDEHGHQLLESLEEKNIRLLKGTNKDLDLLDGVYGSKNEETIREEITEEVLQESPAYKLA